MLQMRFMSSLYYVLASPDVPYGVGVILSLSHGD